ncbi:S1 RNA-binding domain-containing protein [Patescibacteria group bacterium]|nr:S1 RNA-binding domain-containing protein [Patescibacteria group bacterium]
MENKDAHEKVLEPKNLNPIKNSISNEVSSSPMEYLFKSVSISIPKVGDFVDGVIIGRKESTLFIDLGPFNVGIVYGRELTQAKDMVRNLRAGDHVTAKITEMENEQGYVELSLKEAGQEIIWREAQELAERHIPLELKVKEANKGGLVLEWEGIQGFLPASQLRPAHYPRVEGGDKERILDELKKLVGETLMVTIITANQTEDKLIFSEKEIQTDEVKEVLAKYKVGNVIEGEITGVVDFGVFIKIEDNLEGLSHISELSWSLVDDPRSFFEIGKKVKAKIIGIEGGKISLSIKALEPDPWEKVKEKYKKGDIVEGVVIRMNRYGVLVAIEEGVAGLVHISEFGSEKDMREKIELGKTYPFQIILFEPTERRLTLAYLGEENK